MLLGSATAQQHQGTEEELIIQCISQGRYAEAYTLLKKESPNEPAAFYNLALCFHWLGNCREAIAQLDRAQALLQADTGQSNLNIDYFQAALREKQGQTDDHLQPVTKKQIELFGPTFREAIIRLKTDCWLALGDYTKVIESATPIAYKNYRNITDALAAAREKSNS